MADCELYGAINHHEEDNGALGRGESEYFYENLKKNQILIISSFLISIFDFVEGRLIGSLSTDFEDTQFAKRTQRHEIYIKKDCRFFRIFKTGELENGETVVQQHKILYFDRFFYDLSPSQTSNKLTIVKLPNEDYLIETWLKFEIEDGFADFSTELKKVYIEIDGATLEPSGCSRLEDISELDPVDEIQQIYSIDDFLIFAAELDGDEIEESDYQQDLSEKLLKGAERGSYCLVLASLDFEILDCCESAILKASGAIRAISGDKVVSFGLEDNIYLHRVEPEGRKLIHLKSLRFGSGTPLFESIVTPLPSCICCQVIPGDVSEVDYYGSKIKTFVRFDWEFNLIAHFEVNAPIIAEIFPVERCLAAEITLEDRHNSCFFGIDSKNLSFKKTRIPCCDRILVEYKVQEESGRVCLAYWDERSITRILLN